MANDDRISEKQILLVYAHHLFEPLLPNAELFIDKYIDVDDSKCPYCNEEKEKIQPGSTSFGVPRMWHGRADIILKHDKVQQTVTVAQRPSGSSNEPSTKKQKMDSGDKDLNWTVMSRKEQDQDPIPQILSQTIVNAFLVINKRKHMFKEFLYSIISGNS